MTREEMIKELHTRMKMRRKRREQRLTALIGFICVLPLAGLWKLASESSILIGRSTDMYTGSSLLFSKYGGYVLVGVIAFLIGIVLTVIIRNHLEKIDRDESKKQDST